MLRSLRCVVAVHSDCALWDPAAQRPRSSTAQWTIGPCCAPPSAIRCAGADRPLRNRCAVDPDGAVQRDSYRYAYRPEVAGCEVEPFALAALAALAVPAIASGVPGARRSFKAALLGAGVLGLMIPTSPA